VAGEALPRLILASASPRRLQLLRQIGIEPAAVDPVDLDESARPRELPRVHAERLACAKAEAGATRHPEAIVLAADTVVGLGRRILPKATNADEVRHCLTLLSGRRHRVYSAIALALPGGARRARLGFGVVGFKRLSEGEIDAYVRSGDGLGKAGGYAVQGLAAAFVDHVAGSYSAVVGLPLYETATLLQGAGYPLWR
jgi:septum formation protein